MLNHSLLPFLLPLLFAVSIPPDAVQPLPIIAYGHLLSLLGQPETKSPVKFQCPRHPQKPCHPRQFRQGKAPRHWRFYAATSTSFYRQIFGAMHRAKHRKVFPPTHARVRPWPLDWPANPHDARCRSTSEPPQCAPTGCQHRPAHFPACLVRSYRATAAKHVRPAPNAAREKRRSGCDALPPSGENPEG